MMETKVERYNRRTVSAGELADALEQEHAQGWLVQSAENDGDDYVITFEREKKCNPDILKASRKQRIAKGSGTSVQEVNQLLKQFEEMKKMMKLMGSGKMKLPF